MRPESNRDAWKKKKKEKNKISTKKDTETEEETVKRELLCK